MKVVDLFCGCGGLSLGFEKAGMNVVAAFDNWSGALDVYRRNFSHPAIKADLMNVEESVKRIRQYEPDMIIGGPPCQDFSSAGKRDEDNGRGNLTVCYARIIAEVKPKWFVMENVERILKTKKLQEAIDIFSSAGYGLTYTVLNAALCGVPQKRKRFVMIGKLDADNDFMKDALLKNLADHEMSVAEYFGDKLPIKYYYRHPRSYVRRGIFSTSEPSATIRGVNRPMPKGYTLHPGDPVDSLDGIRPLTSKERSMIQTFPENFVFEGTKTNIEQMIGNAVPVNLGYYVADAIFRYSGESRSSEKTERTVRIKQLNFLDLFEQYADNPIVENCMVQEDAPEYNVGCSHNLHIDPARNCLICLVKPDNFEKYVDQSVRIYYTGKKFPQTVALNKLYYFMPYLKGKGIRDLYLIRNVRVGNRKEGQEGEDKNDLRLVFEIDFVKQLFEDYKPVELKIWRTFTDSVMEEVMKAR
ncbi:MAG: DNA cytosine methyltransferase [Prevotella sp.]